MSETYNIDTLNIEETAALLWLISNGDTSHKGIAKMFTEAETATVFNLLWDTWKRKTWTRKRPLEVEMAALRNVHCTEPIAREILFSKLPGGKGSQLTYSKEMRKFVAGSRHIKLTQTSEDWWTAGDAILTVSNTPETYQMMAKNPHLPQWVMKSMQVRNLI